jgi:hypothetical protein
VFFVPGNDMVDRNFLGTCELNVVLKVGQCRGERLGKMKTLTSTRVFTRPISGKFAHRLGFCLPLKDVRDGSRPGQRDQHQPLGGDIAGIVQLGLSYLDLSTAFSPLLL